MKKNIVFCIIFSTSILFSLSVVNFTNNFSNSSVPVIRTQSLDESVLIDKNVGWVIYHGEDDNSSYTTTINDLKAFGADFSLINSEITSGLLSSYDILVIEEFGTSWASSELISLKTWVEGGGALYILGDQAGDSQSSVSEHFNVYYNETEALIGLLTISEPSHPIFESVSNILLVMKPSASLSESLSTESLEILAVSTDGAPILAALLVESGCILWNVDSDGTINNPYIGNADHRQLANNSWIWLATPNPYTGNGPTGPNDLLIPIIIGSSIAVAVIVVIVIVVLKKRGKKV
jgi:hypothetical protein